MNNEYTVATLASSALIVNLSISVWTGRKLDKNVSKEIDGAKHTKTRAGNYHKNLFAGSASLERVNKIAGEARTWHYLMTQPWGDNGDRIVSIKILPEYRAQLGEFEERFVEAVNEFLSEYATLVGAAAFSLGDLFNRDDYPSRDIIEDKFGFKYNFAPLPTAGDFRVDISMQGLEELQEQYTNATQTRIEGVMRDAWERVHNVLSRMSDRLTDDTDGKHKIFRDSLIENALEVCNLLRYFNYTNDLELSNVRERLEQTLRGVDADMLREDPIARGHVKSEVDKLLDKFSL